MQGVTREGLSLHKQAVSMQVFFCFFCFREGLAFHEQADSMQVFPNNSNNSIEGLCAPPHDVGREVRAVWARIRICVTFCILACFFFLCCLRVCELCMEPMKQCIHISGFR